MISQRFRFVSSAVIVLTLLVAIVVSLTVILETPAPENGGSPPYPNSNSTDGIPDDAASDDDDDGEIPGDPGYHSSFGEYQSASVSADAAICSEIGTKILHNGSAVDAAVATAFCVGVVNRHSTGVGGGFFMTVYAAPRNSKEKIKTTLLAREMAPGAAHENMFVDDPDASTYGGKAIAVPGEVKGLYEAWKMFGHLTWAELVLPTAKLCREGYKVPNSLASALKSNAHYVRSDPNLGEIFLNPDGSLLQEGDTAYDLKLADTLDRIADDPLGFYDGELAQDVVDDIKEYDGIITREDLRGYQERFREPLNVTLYNGNYVAIAPTAPSSGVVLQFILKLLDGYYFDEKSISTEQDKILTYHRIMESFKFAYARRSSLGDEEFIDVDELIANLTNDDYIDATRARINDSYTQDVLYYEPDFQYTEDHGTTHLSVIGPDESAVSLTATINTYFGSKCRGSKTGILFNNEMDDFSTPNTTNIFGVPASPSNFIEPGKVPMSSMSPVIIFDENDRPVLISGAAGGTRITTQTAWVIAHNLWFGMRLDEATDTPRLHHQLVPNEISYELAVNQTILAELQKRNHKIEMREGYLAVVCSIHNTCVDCEGDCDSEPCIHSVSDGRKGGSPDGF